MLLSTLQEVKPMLDIAPCDTSQDVKLGFLLEQASGVIQDFLNRPGLFYAVRTEFYSGTNTKRLVLRSRPVYETPTPQVWVQRSGLYGEGSDPFPADTELTYGTDFGLELGEEGQPSVNGILVRVSGGWPRPWVRETGYLSPFLGRAYGNIKVTYAGGYTTDNLPPAFHLATNLLVAKLNNIFPIGQVVGAESYEERSLSYIIQNKNYLLALVKPLLWRYTTPRW